jgi:hypothetical protein
MAKQILSEEFRKMQKLAGIKLNENSSNSMINEENDYTFVDFESSPDEYPYNDVLNMIKSLNDKDILDDFELTFKIGNEPVYKDAYEEFINDRTWWDDEIKKSYLSKWIELGKKLNENELVYAVVINDGEYEQVIYIKNVSDKDELKKIALSKTEIKPHKKIKITKLGVVFSELDDEEKELFKNGDVAVFEPESMD